MLDALLVYTQRKRCRSRNTAQRFRVPQDVVTALPATRSQSYPVEGFRHTTGTVPADQRICGGLVLHALQIASLAPQDGQSCSDVLPNAPLHIRWLPNQCLLG